MQTDGYYLLRPSSDNKGGVLCTICVTYVGNVHNICMASHSSDATYSLVWCYGQLSGKGLLSRRPYNATPYYNAAPYYNAVPMLLLSPHMIL